MTKPLVVVDADVLGRHRTGDETYVEQLLRALPEVATDLRFAAITRRPELVPPGVEPLHLPARNQELRMARSVPALLRRVRPALAHFLHALPLRCPCPAVVTVQDLSWERDPSVMPLRIRLVFRVVVPRAARGAERVLTISERTKREVVELLGVPAERVRVVPNGVEPVFTRAGPAARGDYVLTVGTLEPRKNVARVAEAAEMLGVELRVVGERGWGHVDIGRNGVRWLGRLSDAALAEQYRGARCVAYPSLYEGFGIPVLESMACGTPVVTSHAGATAEVADGAAVLVDPRDPAAIADGITQAIERRDELVARGLERARRFTWAHAAEQTVAVYREAAA